MTSRPPPLSLSAGAVPPHLAVRVLYFDDDVVVIDKPRNLRSVPGHAKSPPLPVSSPSSSAAASAAAAVAGRKRRRDGGGAVPGSVRAGVGGDRGGEGGAEASDDGAVSGGRGGVGDDRAGEDDDEGAGGAGVPSSPPAPPKPSHRRTAQETWIEAIRSFSGSGEGGADNDDEDDGGDGPSAETTRGILRGLASLSSGRSLSSVPRKAGPFARYCRRNRRRLLGGGKDGTNGGKDGANGVGGSDEAPFEAAAHAAHGRIRARQIPLLNLPESTRNEESAWRQLRLLGYGGERGAGESASSLRVVHRLDCETSGVMVFTWTEEAASHLSRSWRECDRVWKRYVARVARWPPYEEGGSKGGTIDLPLAKAEERLKWEVRDADRGGKDSRTLWQVWDAGVATAAAMSAGMAGGGSSSSPGGGDEGENDASEASRDGRGDGAAPRRGGGIVLSLTPLTGQTHQLRVHCAAVGSGIEGDSLYGDDAVGKEPWDPSAVSEGAGMLKLHARELTFPHPRTGEMVTFEAPIPWL